MENLFKLEDQNLISSVMHILLKGSFLNIEFFNLISWSYSFVTFVRNQGYEMDSVTPVNSFLLFLSEKAENSYILNKIISL